MSGLYVILAFVIGWTVAHAIKLGILLATSKKEVREKDLVRRLMSSGGMPSGHTASFSAAVMFVGMAYGFDSPLFAISLCMLTIVIYDAVNVRYAVGEQGKAMNRLIRKVGGEDVRIVEGHTIAEVAVGLVIGVGVGAILYACCG